MLLRALLEQENNPVVNQCQKALSTFNGKLIMRGMNPSKSVELQRIQLDAKYDLVLWEVSTRKDRIPISIDPKTTKLIDNWFEQEFGVRARTQSIFTLSVSNSGGLGHLATFGTPALVYPIGDFSYLWSNNYDDLYHAIDDATEDGDLHSKDSNSINSFMEEGDYQFNSGLKDVRSEEIMIQCDKYIAVFITKHGEKVESDPSAGSTVPLSVWKKAAKAISTP